MKLILCLAILGVTCNAQQRLGNGSGGGGFEGKEKSDLLYQGKRYLDAQIATFGETTVTIIYRDGTAEIPAKHLPMSLLREHKAWLKAQQKEPLSVRPDGPAIPTTTQGWQTAAVKKYPELGVPNSAFNKRFVEEVAERRKTKPGFYNDPKWPMILADELAETLESTEAKKAREIAEIEAKLPQYKMDAKIQQISDEGALVVASLDNGKGMVPLAEPVFVFGISPKIYVDGDHFEGTVWLAGSYRYTSGRTLRAYSNNRENALAHIRNTVAK